MTSHIKHAVIILLATALLLPLSACQLASALTAPTPAVTPLPSSTPTITPTPAPFEMDIDPLLQECERLDQQDATLILTGKVFLPEQTVYGYEGWYGITLLTGARMTVLFPLGSGPNQVEELPQFFHQQHLVIHAADGREIRHGHEVRVTGRPKYRADSETRRCELWVDQVESLMHENVLEPVDLLVEELTDDDNIYECADVEFSRQFVRFTGGLRVDNFLSICQLGICKAVFEDKTGSMTAFLVEGEGPDQMRTLPSAFSNQDLVVRDTSGAVVENTLISLVGVVQQADIGVCEMIVYEVESTAGE